MKQNRSDRPGAASGKQEVRCKGLGVSDGIVIGRVLRLQDGTRDVYRAEIAEADLETRATTLSRRCHALPTPT